MLIEAAGLVFLPARDASLPILVKEAGDDADLQLANGLVLGTAYATIPLGAAAYFFLVYLSVHWLGMSVGYGAFLVVFAVDAFTYVVSYFAIARIRMLSKEAEEEHQFAVARTCPQCGGAGKVIKDPCATCNGAGRIREEKTIPVKIPAGVDEGSRLRVAGEGESGYNGGPAGDLYVFLSVRDHDKFTRRDYDIHSEQTISFTQAALGAEVQTDTLDGAETLHVPPGTQPNQVFRLRGKGVQFVQGSGRGDHYVHVNVRVPSALNDEQRKLLEQFAATEGESPTEARGVFDKVKDFFGG